MSARRSAGAWLTAALALASLPGAAAASASDAFEDKVKPVSGQLYQKAGRFEITPTANLSVNDAFFTKYFFGGKLGYHLNEWLSVGGSFSTGIDRETGSTTVCPANQGCRRATDAQLYQVPGYLKTMAGAEVAFAPIYGKLNLFAEKAIHLDLSIAAGADWIAHREVLGAVQANAGATPGTKNAFGGHVGVGARVFLAEWAALRLEIRDYLYPVSGGLQTQLFAEMGLSIFLPLAHRASP
jgi:outer membrane beta-barrel protein